MNDYGELINQINWFVLAKVIIQIFVLCYAVLWLWRRIAGTHAERLVKGILLLIAIAVASWLLQLTIINSMLQHMIPVAAMALVIVFQPEIRRGLGYLGRMQTFKFDLSLSDTDKARAARDIQSIIQAVRELSRNKTGALIVIEPPEGERDYLSPGTPINADISSTLLLSIFFPKSPLHDGAVVIRKDKIVAGGVILPMTDNQKLSYKYGTRHRAAIGLSETYDGLCIVVSEETGAISAASRGMLARYNNAEDLSEPLAYLYHQGQDESSATPLNSFLSLFGRGKNEGDEAGMTATAAPTKLRAENLKSVSESKTDLKAIQGVTGGNRKTINSDHAAKDSDNKANTVPLKQPESEQAV